jgi:hypothetical protein
MCQTNRTISDAFHHYLLYNYLLYTILYTPYFT